MSKGNTTENDIIGFIFNGTAMPSYGANLVAHLHTADPGEAGTGTTNEATYTGYAAQNVSRDAAGFTVVGNQATNTALLQFPTCTGVGDDETITHLSITTAGGQILYSGALSASLRVTNQVQPQFAIAAISTTED